MKVVFDTNVILNAAMGRPGYEEAQELIHSVIAGEISGIVTANSITDIHYITRKRIGEEKARLVIYNLLSLFDIAFVDGEACLAALSINMDDYEDAVLAVCADREKADYIVSCDQVFLKANSPVPVRTPAELVTMIG